MVIDYSQNVNKFTQLDVVADVANYKVFSRLDLKSACHQIPILQDEN